MKVRDNQRQRLYNTEEKHSYWGIIQIPDIKDINRLISFMRKNKALSPWKLKGLKITIKDGRRRRRASAVGHFTSTMHARIYFPKRTRTFMVVLHEFAHVLTSHKYAGHGPEYCTNYLYLIKHLLGETAYEEMLILFTTNKVQFDYDKYI